ncbi:hypothetical protein IU408_30605, partial [Nocardia cyriacigeorgica]|nr:hypothetical protein [Nocardia cyriacigeorgica]
MNTFDPSNGAYPAGQPVPGAFPDPGVPHGPLGGQEAAPIHSVPWAPTQTGQWTPGSGHASAGPGPMPSQPVAPEAALTQTERPTSSVPPTPETGLSMAPEAAATQSGQWAG